MQSKKQGDKIEDFGTSTLFLDVICSAPVNLMHL